MYIRVGKHECVCSDVLVHAEATGDFRYFPPSLSFIVSRQGFLLNLMFSSWIRLAGQQIPRMHLSLLPSAPVTGL